MKLGGGVTLRDGPVACCDISAYTIPGYATVDVLAAYSRYVDWGMPRTVMDSIGIQF